MKIIAVTLIMTLLGCATSSQNQEEPSPKLICGVKNPAQDLPWLKEIITKAEEDKATGAHQGNYLGTIYVDEFKNQPVFMVKMMMGSGGLYAYAFKCDGARLYFDKEGSPTMFFDIEKKNNVLYTNSP
ncbi:MAG: hypothetical protein H7Z72_11500 [Bacteroidetes bacterium]|nr:hypothetical protein [Fibrella sp.]